MTTKEKIVDYLIAFLLAVLAGVCISIGAVANLASSSKVVGAIFFCVGLFIILNFNFNLFTGKVCYVFNNNWRYSIKCLVILIGNFVGTNLTALMIGATRLESVKQACLVVADTKLNDSLLSLFFLAIFCNILIYVAVEGFKSENSLTKYLSLFFGVATFVLCGFEHCVADMFYFALAKSYTPRTFLCLFIIILGNVVGAVLFELIKKAIKKKTP